MDNGDNDIKHYSAEDITRYWQGKLTPQEMHAMEMAAMDDPFLADAMEGYSNANAATVGAGVIELQTRLKERTSGATVIPLRKKNRWWAVAALLILLCGFGALMYNLFLQTNAPAKQATAEVNKADADVVADKKDTAVATIVPSDTIQALTFANVDSVPTNAGYATLSKPAEKDANGSGNLENKASQSANQTFRYSTAVPKPSQISDTAQVIARAEDETAKRAQKVESLFKENSRNDSPVLTQNDSRRNSPSESLQGRAAGINVQRNAVGPPTTPVNRDNEQYRQQPQRFFNNFNGRVLDRNNQPIANATVGISNTTTTTTTTDQYGNFKIRSYDTVLDLSIASVGYETTRLLARNNQPVDVVLNESNSKMEEVVVTGYGTEKRKKARVSGSTELRVFVIDAEPVVGWSEYNKYIETNKRIGSLSDYLPKDKDTTTAPPKAEVVVSFMISKTGKLSNFIIEKSLGTQRDAEAIRLIKEGPAWRVLKNKKTRARVIIPF